MSPPNGSRTGPSDRSENDPALRRRRFLALGAGTATALLAGCIGDSGSGPGEGSSPTGADAATGTFRLLISDQPVAIDEFDELNVSFERARVFRGESEDEDETETESPTATESPTETESPTATESATETESPTATDSPTETEGNEETETEDDEVEEEFFVIDLDGATVDLTQVVGEKAMGVFDGEIPVGRYTKVELHVASVEGIVDGDPVEVKVPSNKLQIVKPFEVATGETLTFVFDINVVKRGQTGQYNLLPVISGSGVAGEDVEVEEVGEAPEVDEEETESAEATSETEDDAGEG